MSHNKNYAQPVLNQVSAHPQIVLGAGVLLLTFLVGRISGTMSKNSPIVEAHVCKCQALNQCCAREDKEKPNVI